MSGNKITREQLLENVQNIIREEDADGREHDQMIEQRFKDVQQTSAWFVQNGYVVYSYSTYDDLDRYLSSQHIPKMARDRTYVKLFNESGGEIFTPDQAAQFSEKMNLRRNDAAISIPARILSDLIEEIGTIYQLIWVCTDKFRNDQDLKNFPELTMKRLHTRRVGPIGVTSAISHKQKVFNWGKDVTKGEKFLSKKEGYRFVNEIPGTHSAQKQPLSPLLTEWEKKFKDQYKPVPIGPELSGVSNMLGPTSLAEYWMSELPKIEQSFQRVLTTYSTLRHAEPDLDL